jgi:hypothetical protein
MNYFRSIWQKLKRLFTKKPPTTEKIISEESSILSNAIDVEEIYAQIEETNDEKVKEELITKIARQVVAKEILDYVDSEKITTPEKKTGRKRLFELHELRFELQKLEEQKAKLQINKSKISHVVQDDTEIFDTRINNLFALLSKNKTNNSVELSDFQVTAFDKDCKQLERLLIDKSTLKRHKTREQEHKRQKELYESNIKKELNNLDTLIGQNKHEEAKKLASALSIKTKPDYKKGIERLARSLTKIKEKELEIYKKKQAELLRQQEEEAERIRIQDERNLEEKRKQELINNLEFEINPDKEETLDNFKIDYIYHMTDVANLSNILQFGLLSHNEAHSKGLNKKDIALQDVNQRRANKKPINGISLHDYVPMYFNPKNPMLYRRKQIQDSIVILAIDRRLIYQNESIFSDGNAASDSTRFYNNISDLIKLNWQCIRHEYWNDFVDGKRIKCAETLTHPRIPLKYVRKIHCNSIQTKNMVDRIMPINKTYRVELTSKFFFSK